MKRNGFSLVEILITLVILAVVMGLTIPKVLNAQNEKGWNANAKQVAAMLQAAYSAYQEENQPTGSTVPWDLTPFINYIKVDTATVIDSWQTGTTQACTSTIKCLVLPDGGRLAFNNCSFSNTSSTNAIAFWYDPDGKVTNGGSGDTSATAQGKSVHYSFYFDGSITTAGGRKANSFLCGFSPYTANSSLDPPWFDWSK